MKARRLIDGAAFGPETLKVVGQAFDQAWAEIATTFGSDPFQVENARQMLAEALLSVATERCTDVDVLKRAALQAMGFFEGTKTAMGALECTSPPRHAEPASGEASEASDIRRRGRDLQHLV